MRALCALILLAAVLAACNFQAAEPTVDRDPLATEQTVDVSEMFTATPRAESPTPTASPTIEVTPWVDLQVKADVVEKDGWEIPNASEAGSERVTKFFSIMETQTGERYIMWAPYEVNPSEYASSRMYWVQNGGHGSSGPLTSADKNTTNYILNLYYNSPDEFDGIVVPSLDVEKYEGAGTYIYPDLLNFAMGRAGESLEATMKAILNPVLIVVVSNVDREFLLISQNSEIPEYFFEDHGDWEYIVVPFSAEPENPFAVYNALSRTFEGFFGEFEYKEGEFAFSTNMTDVKMENRLNMEDLGSDFEINP